MAKTKHDEKRVAKRVPVDASVPVKITNGHATDMQGQVKDISIRGVYVYLQSQVVEGSPLELVLPMPEGVMEGHDVWIRCKCRVVRVEPTGRTKEFGVAAMIEEYEALEEAQIPQA